MGYGASLSLKLGFSQQVASSVEEKLEDFAANCDHSSKETLTQAITLFPCMANCCEEYILLPVQSRAPFLELEISASMTASILSKLH